MSLDLFGSHVKIVVINEFLYQNKNDEKPVDESNGEQQSECPYKNLLNSSDKDSNENTKLKEAVKEAEESQDNHTESSAANATGEI